MQFIQGTNRHQSYFSTLEDQVSADNSVRLIDAFVDKLEFQQLEDMIIGQLKNGLKGC